MMDQMDTTNFPSRYAHLTGRELSALAAEGKLISATLTEEDFVAIMDYQLSGKNPDLRVMDFCFNGLKRFKKYGMEIAQPDFSTIAGMAGVKKPISIQTPQNINLRDPRIMFGGFHNYSAQQKRSPFEEKIERELGGKYTERIAKNGSVYYIWTQSNSYNITYIDKNTVGNIVSGFSLQDAKTYISLVA